MPRIPTLLLRKAHAIDPFLPALLAPCRDISTAQNELRWLREHAATVVKTRRAHGNTLSERTLLVQFVRERARGKPLQYILGTEFFGDLEIRCREGVLIPRQDTAASILHLVKSLRLSKALPSELRVLDLCTGTGCIPLLFEHELRNARKDVRVQALGVDISTKPLRLAKQNLECIRRDKQDLGQGNIQFIKADVLSDLPPEDARAPQPLKHALKSRDLPQQWDILISNPPYISPSAFWMTTTRSVRGFEPKLALVPPPKLQFGDVEQGDRFYPRLLATARDIEAKVVLLEIADLQQALRVARMARDLNVFEGIEIWREEPDMVHSQSMTEDGFAVVGEGNARSVVCWKDDGVLWLRKKSDLSEE